MIGATVAAIASLTPINKLEEMVNIGTLAAFTLVSVAVVILRHTQPDLERPFKVPFAPVTPILSALICVYMMLNLSLETWARFIVWMALGFVIYFVYGYRKSRVGRDATREGSDLADWRRRAVRADDHVEVGDVGFDDLAGRLPRAALEDVSSWIAALSLGHDEIRVIVEPLQERRIGEGQPFGSDLTSAAHVEDVQLRIAAGGDIGRVAATGCRSRR